MTATADMMKLWAWPWEAASAAGHLAETLVATQTVLGARLPMLAEATANPFQADHSEMFRMVSEKVGAFGRSGTTLSHAGDMVRRVTEANARAFGRIAGGGYVGPGEWFGIFERNVALMSALMSLPLRSIAPIHGTVTSNARRLASPGRGRRSP